MKKQCSKKLWVFLLLMLLSLILSVLGVFIEGQNVDLNGLHEPMIKWLPLDVSRITSLAFDILHFISPDLVLWVPLLTLIFSGAGAFLLYQKKMTGKKLGMNCIWSLLLLNMLMAATCFYQAVLGMILDLLPIAQGMLSIVLCAAGTCLLIPGYRIAGSLKINNDYFQIAEENQDSRSLHSRKISALLILLVLLAGVILNLSVYAGMHEFDQGGVISPFFDQFWADAQNSTGGGIIILLFGFILWMMDVFLFVLTTAAGLLGVVLALIFMVVSFILIKREHPRAGRVCAILALVLETIPFLLEVILIEICLHFQSLPLIPLGIPMLFLCLTVGVLLLMGYWLLPDLVK